jgi:hypothetical protein
VHTVLSISHRYSLLVVVAMLCVAASACSDSEKVTPAAVEDSSVNAPDTTVDTALVDTQTVDAEPDSSDLADIEDSTEEVENDTQTLPDTDGDEGDAPEETSMGDTAPDADNDTEDTTPECDDKNPCTSDEWIEGECVSTYVYGICCTANPMCDDADPCTLDKCIDGYCEHEDTCCVVDTDCDDNDPQCTTDSCVVGQCLNVLTSAGSCCDPNVIQENFDGQLPAKFKVKNAQGDVGWQIYYTGQSKSEPGALWYGNPSTGDYDNGFQNDGDATFGPMTLTPSAPFTLSFDVFMDIEKESIYDEFGVYLDVPAWNQTVLLWSKSKTITYLDWVGVTLDLSGYAGQTVSLRFHFDTMDANGNTGSGIFVDNLSLVSACAAVECTTNLDCDDSSNATIDWCLEGKCAYSPNGYYCTSYKQCDDGVPCTYNVCINNECIYNELSNCCISDSECDDGDPCTFDDCVGAYGTHGGYCKQITIPECCMDNTSCDDGNPCTIDSCPGPGNPCVHQPVTDCCDVDSQCDDGDSCTEDVCQAGSCSHIMMCCASDADCDDGDPLCTDEKCVDGVCQKTFVGQPGCCTLPLLFSTFSSSGMDGFSEVNDLFPGDDVGWMAVASPSSSVGGSLHYGRLTGTYDTGYAHSGDVLSPIFSLSPSNISVLSFMLYLDNEWSNGVGNIGWDRLRVWALPVSDPTGEILVWDSGWGTPKWWADTAGEPSGPKWTPVVGIDLSALKGQSVRLRISFDTIDADANAFSGAYIDDVKVVTPCSP